MLSWMNHKLESRCWEKYQQLQIRRWYYTNGRKQRGAKEPTDKGERGEWKSWLKTQHSEKKKNEIMVSGPITSWQIEGEKLETVVDFIFLGSKITVDGDCSHEIKRCLLLGRKALTNLDSVLKKQTHYFADKGPDNQSYGFSSSHVWMWELDHKEGWVPKNWCFRTVVESPLDNKEIKAINPKGNQSWIWFLMSFISFRMDSLNLLAVQGTLKSLLQHLSSKASILWCSAFFIVQLSTSIHDHWKNHSLD